MEALRAVRGLLRERFMKLFKMFKEKKQGQNETYVGVSYELPDRLKQKQKNLDKQLE